MALISCIQQKKKIFQHDPTLLNSNATSSFRLVEHEIEDFL